MKKIIVLLLCVAMTLSMMTGCGNKEAASTGETNTEATNTEATNTEATDTQTADVDPLKVALCVTGAVNDMGWNQSAYEGLLLVEKEYGCEVAYTENLGAADIEATFTDYAASGYDVVIGHGFQFGDPALAVGEQFPDTKFICIESQAAAENVASYVMKCEEGGYLMGMLAASLSENGKLGFIGPMQGASLVKIMNGYEDGAKSINPNIEIQTAWTGSFTDTALAKESATAMIENGVDMIGHCANECGTGAIDAAREAGILVTGDSYDQYELAPEAIVSSTIYNVPELIKVAINDILEGNFKGEIKQLGIAEGIVNVAPYHDFEDKLSTEVKTLIEEKVNAIKSGEFEVPCDTTPRN